MEKNYSSLAEEVEKDFQKWFDDAAYPEPIAEADHSKRDNRLRRVGTPQKLAEAFIFGGVGAVFLATIVGLFLEFLRYWGMYSKNWSDTILFIFLAAVVGFFGGMGIGLSSKLRS